MLPRSDENRQAAEGAKLHRAVAVMLDANQRPQQRRRGRRVLAGEPLDVGCGQADRAGDALRRVLLHPLDKRVVADGVPGHVVVIDQIVADDHVHHGERERGVAAGPDLQVPVGGLGGAGPDGIDDDEPGPAALRFAYERPEMQVGDDRVGAPQHDVAAVDDLLGIDPGAGADRDLEAGRCHGAADVAIQIAASHRSEQTPIERRLLNHSLDARRTVRQDRLGARFVHDGLPSRCDVPERLVPTDAFEPRLTLPADALERWSM